MHRPRQLLRRPGRGVAARPLARPIAAQTAFTLAEALLAATILAIVAASALLPFTAGLQQVDEAARLEQAVALGEGLMEEILARPFTDPQGSPPTPGPETGESTRDQYDNIDDFHGFSEAATGLKNFQAAALTAADFTGFWRDASVQYVTFSGLGQQASDVNSLVHVRVRVWQGTRLLVTLDRIAYREN